MINSVTSLYHQTSRLHRLQRQSDPSFCLQSCLEPLLLPPLPTLTPPPHPPCPTPPHPPTPPRPAPGTRHSVTSVPRPREPRATGILRAVRRQPYWWRQGLVLAAATCRWQRWIFCVSSLSCWPCAVLCTAHGTAVGKWPEALGGSLGKPCGLHWRGPACPPWPPPRFLKAMWEAQCLGSSQAAGTTRLRAEAESGARGAGFGPTGFLGPSGHALWGGKTAGLQPQRRKPSSSTVRSFWLQRELRASSHGFSLRHVTRRGWHRCPARGLALDRQHPGSRGRRHGAHLRGLPHQPTVGPHRSPLLHRGQVRRTRGRG